MFARAESGAILGVDAHPVTVETHRAKGLPGMALIGLARGAVRESDVRVKSAIIASEVSLGSYRLLANLLPADLPKEGSGLDLPLAAALLASAGVIPTQALRGRRFFGELSLGGGVEGVRGAVLMADLARRRGDRELLVPLANAAEAAVIPGISVIGVPHLKALIAHLTGGASLLPATASRMVCPAAEGGCFSEVRGQRRAKRAMEIAAAGGHNILMIGPPGSGKTMLARRLAGILPPLDPQECIDVTRIHSAAGLLTEGAAAVQRPFRAPHHSASEPALCGGGSVPRPGEVTLAHRGVLFLDELPEFSRRALESLREPLEEGCIHIARAAVSLTFPADVLLVTAMNPCPCGRFRGDFLPRAQQPAGKRSSHPTCMCSFEQIQRYRSRISGPLLDRIDLHVVVDAVPYRDFAKSGSGERSDVIANRVLAARQRQVARLGPVRTNARMTQKETQRWAPLSSSSMELVEKAIDEHGLSTRAVGRIVKMARTVADLDECPSIDAKHVREAIGFRLLDQRGTPLV